MKLSKKSPETVWTTVWYKTLLAVNPRYEGLTWTRLFQTLENSTWDNLKGRIRRHTPNVS